MDTERQEKITDCPEPRFVVGTHPGFSSPCSILIGVHRIDGTAGAAQRADALSAKEAARLFGELIERLPPQARAARAAA